MKTRQVKMLVASQTAVLGLEWYCWSPSIWEMEPSIQEILKICLKTARRIKWFCLSPHSALLDILFTIGITNSCTHWPVRSNMLSWAFLPQLPPFGTARSSDAAPARFFCLGKSWPAWPATYMWLLGAGGIYHSGGEKKTPPKPNQNIPSCCCSSSLPIVGSSTRRVISLLCSAASKFHVIPETVPVRSSMNYLCPSHSGEKKAKSLRNSDGILDSQILNYLQTNCASMRMLRLQDAINTFCKISGFSFRLCFDAFVRP